MPFLITPYPLSNYFSSYAHLLTYPDHTSSSPRFPHPISTILHLYPHLSSYSPPSPRPPSHSSPPLPTSTTTPHFSSDALPWQIENKSGSISRCQTLPKRLTLHHVLLTEPHKLLTKTAQDLTASIHHPHNAHPYNPAPPQSLHNSSSILQKISLNSF